MQLQIDLTNQPVAYGRRIIKMIEAFYDLESVEIRLGKDDVGKLMSATEAFAPLAQSAVAPSTAAADPSSTAPAVTPATSAAPIVPPVPALPTVPVATVQTEPAAPTSPASGVAVDKTGLPWDARIHSSSKAVNADGTWRKRKGLNDDAFVKRIEDELRAVMAVPVASPTAVFGIPDNAIVPPPPPPAAELPPVPAAPVADPTTLPELTPRVTEKMIAGLIPNDALITAVNQCELPDLPSLAHRPDMIPKVWAQLKANCPGVW